MTPANSEAQAAKSTAFVCYCGDSKVKFRKSYLQEIRNEVCQDLPFYAEVDGKRYCVLHCPSKEKTDDFQTAFQARIAQGNWDFRMVWFPLKLTFEGETFNHDAWFSSATFAARVTFKHCKFLGRFEFFDSKFIKSAEFLYSEFSKSANFNSAEFQDYGDFAFVRFRSSATFTRSKFYSGSFHGTHFYGDVDFNGTTFTDYASFLQTKCFLTAKFTKIVFPKPKETSFRDAEFHHTINFDESVFAETDFTTTRFSLSGRSPSDKPTFRKVKFNELTKFTGAFFGEEADFTQASFAAVAFERATFARGVRFTACDFLSLAYFHETKFGEKKDSSVRSGHALFDYALFGEDSRLFFQNTWFSYVINFDYAAFKGHVYFKGGLDHPVFDSVFETQALTSLLNFLNATIYNPERIHFHTVRLRPHWFVNVDCRKFNLTNIDWLDEHGKPITEKGELKSVSERRHKNPEELLAIVFRQLAANAEDNSRLLEASLFRRMAMETDWINRKKEFARLNAHVHEEIDKQKQMSGTAEGYTPTPPLSFFGVLRRSSDSVLHFLYRSTSFYGESWVLAGAVLVVILIAFALLYTRIQFYVCPADRPIAQSSQQNLCQTRKLMFYEAMRHSLATATFQTVDHRKPATSTGETLTLLEKIFAPIQVALLALAIRRKFMR